MFPPPTSNKNEKVNFAPLIFLGGGIVVVGLILLFILWMASMNNPWDVFRLAWMGTIGRFALGLGGLLWMIGVTLQCVQRN